MLFSIFASQIKSGKNACSADLHMVFIRVVGFVWRQLGLAFFGAQLRLRTFLFDGGETYERILPKGHFIKLHEISLQKAKTMI